MAVTMDQVARLGIHFHTNAATDRPQSAKLVTVTGGIQRRLDGPAASADLLKQIRLRSLDG